MSSSPSWQFSDNVWLTIIVSDTIFCVVLLIFLRIFLYYRKSILSIVTLLILSIFAFPVTLLWLFAAFVMNLNSGLNMRHSAGYHKYLEYLSVKEALFVAGWLPLTSIIPSSLLLGFILSVTYAPDFSVLWISLLTLHILCFAVVYVILAIIDRQRSPLLCICCCCGITIGIIIFDIGFIIYYALFVLYLYYMIIKTLIGIETIEECIIVLKGMKYKRRCRKEYLKLKKFKGQFLDERREYLYKYIYDENVVEMIIRYLYYLEDCDGIANDETVVRYMHRSHINLEMVDIHVRALNQNVTENVYIPL